MFSTQTFQSFYLQSYFRIISSNMLKKKIKAFFNKEGFDFTEDHIDPTKYHVTFFFMMRAYQVADEPYKTWT